METKNSKSGTNRESVGTNDKVVKELKFDPKKDYTLTIEQEVYEKGEKKSKGRKIKVGGKYAKNEISNLKALGYTVRYQGKEV